MLDVLDLDPNAAEKGVTIEVFGEINGDNGCGGKGLKTRTTFRLGKYDVGDINNPDSFVVKE